jgi:hypothetical protein
LLTSYDASVAKRVAEVDLKTLDQVTAIDQPFRAKQTLLEMDADSRTIAKTDGGQMLDELAESVDDPDKWVDANLGDDLTDAQLDAAVDLIDRGNRDAIELV